jgi:Xaa-Pro aminopeptidase
VTGDIDAWDPDLVEARHRRLCDSIVSAGFAGLLTADPITISYATGVRNMNVFSMMGPFRFLLVVPEGPTVLYEYAGAEHLAETSPVLTDVRPAPGVTAVSGQRHRDATQRFAAEIASLISGAAEARSLGIERVEFTLADALRGRDLGIAAGTEAVVRARAVKLDSEITIMREAVVRVEAAVAEMRRHLVPGATEIEVWAEFQRHLIAHEGEYVSTRLAQTGPRTVPYFREAAPVQCASGDIFCLDTDAIGFGGYAVDFSRAYLVGSGAASDGQRTVHALALEQLRHNAEQLAPHLSFEDYARSAWPVPDRYRRFAYGCLAHGLGMCGEWPYVPHAVAGEPFGLDGSFEPGMVICVESYVGHPDDGFGVKLEDQYLITDDGAERMSTAPFDAALSRC